MSFGKCYIRDSVVVLTPGNLTTSSSDTLPAGKPIRESSTNTVMLWPPILIRYIHLHRWVL